MPDEACLRKSRPAVSVLDFSVEEILAFLRGRLRTRKVTQAYLIGSVAAGRQGAWSDLDVVVVKPSDLSPVDRGREFMDLFDLGLPVDILVYTPEEFADLPTTNPGFWGEIEGNHVRLV